MSLYARFAQKRIKERDDDNDADSNNKERKRKINVSTQRSWKEAIYGEVDK